MGKYRLGYDEVRALLPQQYPFQFIDAVAELEGDRIVCIKNVTGNEWMLSGHFPKKAVFPGVLMTEAMAQAAILLVKLGQGGGLPSEAGDRPAAEDRTFLLTGTKMRFLKPVVPGDQMVITCRMLTLLSSAAVAQAEIAVDGVAAARGELTFAMLRSDTQEAKPAAIPEGVTN
ncbi:3-hydroxyacyl-ACP dehydratase FabZ [Paenibacillus kobensis]|uniref:3-hydroxyacyl-ACP dehydratase FabZ n=1 Tax=Paenibacillus kobensis TaxID=59841 RepID=UPI000FD913F8|nr:3-hydroxyacyl-ACP dehydratase FabZ [Paenibacillus kobensis]